MQSEKLLSAANGYRHKDKRVQNNTAFFQMPIIHTTSCLPQRQQFQEQPISQYSNSHSEIHISHQNLQFCLLGFPE